MGRKLHVFLSRDWENALFAYGFNEIQLDLTLDERLKTIRKWMVQYQPSVLALRNLVKTYYEHLLRFTLDPAEIYVVHVYPNDAIISVQSEYHFRLPPGYEFPAGKF